MLVKIDFMGNGADPSLVNIPKGTPFRFKSPVPVFIDNDTPQEVYVISPVTGKLGWHDCKAVF